MAEAMSAPKHIVRGTALFYKVDPKSLEGFDEWAEWLDSLLHGPCEVMECQGDLILTEQRQLVTRLTGLKIEIYPNEHAPPHFHVNGPGARVSFAIKDCSVIDGVPSGKLHRTIRYWHREAKPKLIEVWDSTRPTSCPVGPYRQVP